jgi:hypothetical protein
MNKFEEDRVTQEMKREKRSKFFSYKEYSFLLLISHMHSFLFQSASLNGFDTHI